MALIQDATLGRKLLSRFGIRGPAPAQFLAPEIVPVVLVEDLVPPTLHDGAEERLAFGGAVQAAVAGQYSYIQLLNPADSGVRVVVESAIASRSSAGRLEIREYDTACTTLGTAADFRDRRLNGPPASQIRTQTNAGSLGTFRLAVDVANTIGFEIPIGMILDEGMGLVIRVSDVNVAEAASFWWVEYSKGVST